MTFRPVVLVAGAGAGTGLAWSAAHSRAFRWHYFQLEQRNATCSGILLPLFGDGLLQATRQGSVAMKTALKNRAEAS